MRQFTRPLLLLLLVLLPHGHVRAQEKSGRFDPIPFLGTLSIGREWYEGSIVRPPHSIRSFTDTVHAAAELVGLTLVQRDSLPGGWVMRLMFDANRMGQLSLVSVSGAVTVRGNGARELARLAAWITTVLKDKVEALESDDPARIARWSWTQKSGYVLTVQARRTSKPKSRIVQSALTLSLERG